MQWRTSTESRSSIDHGVEPNTRTRRDLEILECFRHGSPTYYHLKCTISDKTPGVIARRDKFSKLLCTREENMRINEAVVREISEREEKKARTESH